MQAPSSVVMVRPHFFTPNQETAQDNVFQKQRVESLQRTNQKAYEEVTEVINTLGDAGVRVYPFDDKNTATPDSVFPNNWFSTHPCGTVVVYPMYCQNRRLEINPVILDKLDNDFVVNKTLDLSNKVEEGRFLEGTGAMVLDHDNKIAYAVRSKRMDEDVLDKFCQELGFTPCIFDASDDNGIAVYHTNVLMSVATDFVMIGLDMIPDPAERQQVQNMIKRSGKYCVELSTEQINHFAGNTLEMKTPNGHVLAMSKTAHEKLTSKQTSEIEQFVDIVVVNIPTIEQAGGSIRCMLAGVHLQPKTH